MTSILFERTKHAYLPEISAYRAYLARHFPHVQSFDSAALADADPQAFDIVWRFMGLDARKRGRYVVHEYNSLSSGVLPLHKNRIKTIVNGRPNRRVFLNETVQSGFHFHDNVPSALRDMGVDDGFFQAQVTTDAAARPYDFVYAGNMNRGAALPRLLAYLTDNLPHARILLIGEPPATLAQLYDHNPAVTFTGRVPYVEVPALLAQARYGLNIMPDIYPYHVQTATKVLEYCALGLPVISTDYHWVRSFMSNRDARFFLLRPDMANLTPENLAAFDFKGADVSDLRWDTIITRAGLFDFLKG